MSNATVILHPLHPATRKLSAATGWEQSVTAHGMRAYVPRRILADFFERIVEAHTRETARTNANIARMPRYRRQFRGVRLGDEPPSPPDAA